MVENLTEAGGHFRLTRISLLWVDLGSHRFNRFNKKVNKTTSQQVNEFVELIRVQWKGRGYRWLGSYFSQMPKKRS